MSGQDDEHVYYNIRVLNDISTTPEKLMRAEFQETRVIPVLTNPNEYELAVVRFKVPTSSIPLFVWTDDEFEISLSFNGTTVATFIQYGGGGGGDVGPYGRAVYSYNTLAELFNITMTSTYNSLKIAQPTLTGEIPFMLYDPITELYSIYVDPTWDESIPGAPIIGTNTAFIRMLPSFQISFNASVPEAETWIIRVRDQRKNTEVIDGISYLRMDQEFPTLALVSQFTNIAFRTARIPVVGEYLTAGGTNATQSIITDFNPTQAAQDRTAIQFFPQGPLRFYPLKGTDELRTLDIAVFWEDTKQNSYPLFLQPGDSLSVKIMFRRRKHILYKESLDGNTNESVHKPLF